MPASEVMKLYGAAWSVYVRIVRLAVEEKHVKYDLVEADVFAAEVVSNEHLTRPHSAAFLPLSMAISVL